MAGMLESSEPLEIEKALRDINAKYLQMIGERIREIGQLSATDVHRLNQMREYGADVDEIERELAAVSGKSGDEITRIFNNTAEQASYVGEEMTRFLRADYIPYSDNIALQRYVTSVAAKTASAFANLANTSVIAFRTEDLAGNVIFKGLGDTYKDVIDEAIYEVTTGVTDYNSAMRSTLRGLADSGIRTVDYASGRSMRLDSAVRMNILSGAREVFHGVQAEVGRSFGSDGVEISAHGMCAPDHLPYQGRQYSNREYQQIQDSLPRKIESGPNCHHMAFRILMGISKPAYSDDQLDEMEEMSTRKITFDGAEYSGYEATQLQRRIETKVRAARDRMNLAKASGDDVLRRIEQLRISGLKQKYVELSETFGLKQQTNRMSVGRAGNVKTSAND